MGRLAAVGRSGHGTYDNPILPSDYSDLDCIRVGSDYYAISSTFQLLGVSQDGPVRTLEFRVNGKVTPGPALQGSDLWLKSSWGLDGQSQYAYSTDGRTFSNFGDLYALTWGHYRGDRIGIYTFNNQAEAGFVDVDSFTQLHTCLNKKDSF